MRRLALVLLLQFLVIANAGSAIGETASLLQIPSDSLAGRANRLGLAVGLLHLQIRDDIIAPMRWSGLGASITLSYDRDRESSRTRMHLKFPVSFFTNRYGHEGAATGYALGYRYVRRVPEFGIAGTSFVGGAFLWNVDLQYYYDWDEEHLYWLTALDLALVFQHEVLLKPRNRLVFRFTFPLISLVSRPPDHRYYKSDNLDSFGLYFSKPYEGIHLTSLNEHLSMTLSLHYTFPLTRSWGFGTDYELGYRRFTDPETIQILSNTLSGRLTREF